MAFEFGGNARRTIRCARSPDGAGSSPIRQNGALSDRTAPAARVRDSRSRCRSVEHRVLARRNDCFPSARSTSVRRQGRDDIWWLAGFRWRLRDQRVACASLAARARSAFHPQALQPAPAPEPDDPCHPLRGPRDVASARGRNSERSSRLLVQLAAFLPVTSSLSR